MKDTNALQSNMRTAVLTYTGATAYKTCAGAARLLLDVSDGIPIKFSKDILAGCLKTTTVRKGQPYQFTFFQTTTANGTCWRNGVRVTAAPVGKACGNPWRERCREIAGKLRKLANKIEA